MRLLCMPQPAHAIRAISSIAFHSLLAASLSWAGERPVGQDWLVELRYKDRPVNRDKEAISLPTSERPKLEAQS